MDFKQNNMITENRSMPHLGGTSKFVKVLGALSLNLACTMPKKVLLVQNQIRETEKAKT